MGLLEWIEDHLPKENVDAKMFKERESQNPAAILILSATKCVNQFCWNQPHLQPLDPLKWGAITSSVHLRKTRNWRLNGVLYEHEASGCDQKDATESGYVKDQERVIEKIEWVIMI